MLKILTTGETPPGGWRHVESHSGIPIPEKGILIRDKEQFLRMIIAHRKATGGDLEIGWAERLDDELCQEHPNYPCVEEGPPSERRLTLSDLKNFLHAASTFIDSGASFVPQEEAESRAAICARCPLNVPVTGCFGCAGIANAAMDFIAQRKTEQDDKLQSCQICGCFMRVKVWMPKQSDGQPYPEWCWQKDNV